MTYQWRNDFFISKTVTHAFTIWIYQCAFQYMESWQLKAKKSKCSDLLPTPKLSQQLILSNAITTKHEENKQIVSVVYTLYNKYLVFACVYFCFRSIYNSKTFFFVFYNGVFFHLRVLWPTKTILFWTKLIFCFFVCSKKYSFYIPNCIWNKYHVEAQFAKVSKDKTRTHVKIPQQCNLCAFVCVVMVASEVAFLMWLIRASTKAQCKNDASMKKRLL